MNNLVVKKEKAIRLFKNNKLIKAEVLLKKVCHSNVVDHESLFILGSCQKLLGKNKAAIPNLIKSINIDPLNDCAHYVLADALYATGEIERSVQSYEKSISINKNISKRYHNYGNALSAIDKFKESLLVFKKLIAMEPSNGSAYNSLGNQYKLLGEYDKAKESYLYSIHFQPNLSVAYSNLGSLLKDQYQYYDAVIMLRHAIELDSSMLDTKQNLAACLIEIDCIDEAKCIFNSILKENPCYIELLAGLVSIFSRNGDYDGALELLLKYRNINPHDLDAISLHADILEKTNDIDASIAVVMDAYKDNKYSIELSVVMLKLCHKIGNCNEVIKSVETLLSSSEYRIDNNKRIVLHSSMGKKYDSLCQYYNAFEHYKKSNELKGVRLDRETLEKKITGLINSYTPELMSELNGLGNPTERPVFIVGMPRSGTTLIEQILDAHPLMYGAGELSYIKNIGNKEVCTVSDKNSLLTDAGTVSQDAIFEMAHGYLKHISEHDKKSLRVIDKMPHNFMQLGLISILFPRARIIHVRRNPIDTCLSCYFTNFSRLHSYSYNLDDLSFYYKQYQRLMQHWRLLLGDHLTEIIYEDLIDDSVKVSRILVEATGLPWDDACLEYYKSGRHVSTASYDQVRRPIYRSSVGRWRNYESNIAPLMSLLDD